MTSVVPRALAALALLVVTCTGAGRAAELKPDLLAAWTKYISEADSAMEARLGDRARYLWLDEKKQRLTDVRAGNVIAEPFFEDTPKHVGSGLIHHWIGAVFVPGAHVSDATSVLRDYDRYGSLYAPTVVRVGVREKTPNRDRFTITMMNNSLFGSAVECEWEARFAWLEGGRWYSISRADRVVQIDNFQRRSEHRLAPNHGDGYVWRLHTITRVREGDGGAYLEAEAIVLSRDIPPQVRWFVEPIVRRVSRNSLLISLRQTADAMRANAHSPAPHPVSQTK